LSNPIFSPKKQEKLLRVGDQILRVNGQTVDELTSSSVAEMMQLSDEIELTVSSHTIVPLPHHSPMLTSSSSSSRPVAAASTVKDELG